MNNWTVRLILLVTLTVIHRSDWFNTVHMLVLIGVIPTNYHQPIHHINLIDYIQPTYALYAYLPDQRNKTSRLM